MSNDPKGWDWSTIIMALAGVLLLAVLVIFIGGWLFAIAWGNFMVPTFGLPEITTTEGIYAMLLLFVSGRAFTRGSIKTTK